MSSSAATPKKTPVVKPRFLIYISTVTDGSLPESSNLLSIHAYHSDTLRWSRNILPQRPERVNARVAPTLRESLRTDAVPIDTAIREFAEWLERFKGKRVAATSAVAYWHLAYHFQRVLGKSPLAAHPLDVSSYVAGAHGQPLYRSGMIPKDPAAALAHRQEQVRSAERVQRASRW